jgi:uncharacterized protein YqgC (DUF456 family)
MALFGRPSPREEDRARRWGEWVRRQDGFAIASLVLGVFSLLELGALIVPGLAGVVIGILALRRIARTGRAGRGLALAGVVLSVLSLVAAGFLYWSQGRSISPPL